MANEKRWAKRKIRTGGRVKIGGYWYRPSEQYREYDGRLDGEYMLFARYMTGDKREPFLSLWGPVANMTIEDTDDWIDDPQVVDGKLPWAWWEREGECSARADVLCKNSVCRVMHECQTGAVALDKSVK